MEGWRESKGSSEEAYRNPGWQRQMLRAEQADVATLGRASLAGFTACTELKSKIKDDSVLFFFI